MENTILLLEDKLTKALDIVEKWLKSYSNLYEFGKCEESDELEYFNPYDALDMLCDIDPQADFATGASKLVFILPSISKVIKIPFKGQFWYQEGEYDEETEEYGEGEEVFDPFYTEDYCALEEEIWYDADNNYCGEFFAKTEFARNVKGLINIYVAERVICYENAGASTASEDSKKKVREDIDFRSIGPHDWMAEVIDYYGEEIARKFTDYIIGSNYDIIGDLHHGNVGYRLDGAPVILDYSGFSN